MLAANFVVGEDGTTDATPANGSLHRSVEEIFFDLELSPKTKPDVKPRTKRESPEAPAVPRASRSVWITQLLAEKLAEFRPRATGNPECNAQSEIYQQHLKNLTLWAMQMREASAKSASGYLYGQPSQLGNFDECVSVQDTAPGVSGRYCLAKIEFSPTYRLYPEYYSFPLEGLSPSPDVNVWEYVKKSREPARERRDFVKWAVCVPAACSWKDVEESLREVLADVQKEHNIFVNVTLNERQCSAHQDDGEFPAKSKLFLTFLLVLTGISIVVTGYHHILIHTESTYQGGTFWKIMMGFSMVKSFRSLTNTGGGTNLNGLDGLKFISMVMIIFGHRLMFTLGSAVSNAGNIEKDYLGPSITIISTQLVDTFFTVSGFLTFWLLYPAFKRASRAVIPFTLFYRWLRMMPLYMMILAFFVLVFPYIDDGPLWKTIVWREVERCQENWWTNLLVINNYVNTEKMCTVHGWYLACDLQFFALGALIVYTFTRSQSRGLKMLLTALLFSWVIPFANTYLNDYDGILRSYIRVLSDPISAPHYRDFYVKGHNRAAPYLLGILSAYLVTVLREKKVKISMGMRWFVVLMVAVVAEGSQMYAWKFFDIHTESSLIERSFYAAFHRSLWSLLACSIIIVHLCWGFGSSLEYILCHDFYVPMSRLTFGAFLVHPFLQMYTSADVRAPIYFSHWRMVWMGTGDVFSSYAIAFWLYCIIEAPAGILSSMLKRIIMRQGPRRSKESAPPASVEKAPEVPTTGTYVLTDREAKTTNAEIANVLPRDTVCISSASSVEEPQESATVASFSNYTIKPSDSAQSADRPQELSNKLESMLTPS
ncbi:unnamed protein product [Bemisia tabaci]|uniref:Nose resistant-to-fluoxetine protein N-terminal domain-containing protein n=1 Tax=Bemisia tabaci TaxID=7038 RepID=A0A9P0EZY4_BEMTA|nr:unnamed protein product [Bemisia tabaci]